MLLEEELGKRISQVKDGGYLISLMRMLMGDVYRDFLTTLYAVWNLLSLRVVDVLTLY